MKNNMKPIILFLFALIAMAPLGCKDDAYDGLQDIDPYPENAVTFPEATENGFTLMDDNAFIINQNSITDGQVTVKIKGPVDKQIASVEAKAQRFRGAIVWPNISPTVPTAAASRAPSAFSRTVTSNLGIVQFTPASEVTYTVAISSLPASLTNGTLGAVSAPAATNPSYDVFRFFFVVTYTDNTSVVSNEVRVIVKG
jgi:hypothetical protein